MEQWLVWAELEPDVPSTHNSEEGARSVAEMKSSKYNCAVHIFKLIDTLQPSPQQNVANDAVRG